MIENNVVKFGYGDIVVSHNGVYLKFEEVQNPKVIGQCVRDSLDLGFSSLTGKQIKLRLNTIESLGEFSNLLKGVTQENCVFTYIDNGVPYVFDFSMYNASSIKVVYEVFESYRYTQIIPLAC